MDLLVGCNVGLGGVDAERRLLSHVGEAVLGSVACYVAVVLRESVNVICADLFLLDVTPSVRVSLCELKSGKKNEGCGVDP